MICAIILCAAFVPFTSCAVWLDLFEEDYIEWYSEDKKCGFTSTLSDFSAYGYFTVNGIVVRAYFEASYDASLKITFPYSDDMNIVTESGGISYDTSYGECGGKVEGYREGDVFHVTNMRVGYTSLGSFDLYRRKVEPSTVDARDFTACIWTADDGCMTIQNGMSGLDEYVATVETGGNQKSVYFEWLDNSQFEISDKRKYEADRNVLANGTYTNHALELSLTFETDTAFGFAGKTVKLTGKMI